MPDYHAKVDQVDGWTWGTTGNTLRTRAPAPAATIPAAVLTLNKLWPSPPVPTISTTKSVSVSWTATFNARVRRTEATATIDSDLCQHDECAVRSKKRQSELDARHLG